MKIYTDIVTYVILSRPGMEKKEKKIIINIIFFATFLFNAKTKII